MTASKFAWLVLAAMLVSLKSSPCLMAQSPPQGQPVAKVNGTSSATENAIDWLDKIIASPKDDGEKSVSLFSSPEARRSAIKTGATLTLVVSLFLLVVFLFRLRPGASKKFQPGRIPDEVVCLLGEVPFVHDQQLRLLRLGTRLLLVATSPNGCQTLGEITDPEEVYQIEAACRTGKLDLLTDALRRRAGRAVEPSGESQVSLGSHRRGGRTLLEA